MFYFVSPGNLRMTPEYSGCVVARFIFKPDHAPQFVEQDGQLVVETIWDDVLELVEFCQGIEGAIEDCLVMVEGAMFSLLEMSRNAG